MLSAMQAIPQLTGTEEAGFNFSIFTGELTAHDSDNQYSRCVTLEWIELDFDAVDVSGLMSSLPRQVRTAEGPASKTEIRPCHRSWFITC